MLLHYKIIRMIKSPNILADPINRSLTLDVIRGFAVIGMIFVNILVFVPDINDYKIIYVLFDGKMRALFALLFGAGIIIFFQSNTVYTINKSDYFSRRMLWLLLLGLIHAYFLLWPGSILFEYAVCGLLLFTLRVLSAKILIILSCLILGFYIYLNSKDYSESYETYIGYERALQMERANQVVPDDLLKKKEKFEEYLENFPPFSITKKEKLEEDKIKKIKLYRSSLINIYDQNINTANESLSLGVYLNILESLGTMLLGMALFKLGFFEFKLKKYLYFFFILIGIPLGVFLYFLLYKCHQPSKNELLEIYSWKSFSEFIIEGPARIIFSLGYCSLLIYVCRLHFFKPILVLLGNVGRMALSNYVIQTVICVLCFYMLNYYGSFNIKELTIFSVSIILFQLTVSYFCIKYFRSGPIEYLWRKLSQKNLQESATNTNSNK